MEAVGSAVTSVAPGDHVVLSAASCGVCAQCLSGKPMYCENAYDQCFGGRRPDGTTALSSNGEAVFLPTSSDSPPSPLTPMSWNEAW
ncbi:hypothetical protein SHIRM173S_03930 [Streptomyces hirsutus]